MFVTKNLPKISEPVKGAVSLDANDNGLDIMLSPCGTPVKEITLTWDLDITKFDYISTQPWGFSPYGKLGFYKINEEEFSAWYFTILKGDEAHCFGVKTGCNSFCSWRINKSSITLVVDVRNGGEGVDLLNPLHCATVISTVSTAGEAVFSTTKRFCSLMCDKPKLPKIPIYGSNTWYHTYGDNMSRESVLQDADLCALLASGRVDGAPEPYMVIDDGWSSTRVPHLFNGGPYIPSENFGDMKILAEEISAKGCRPGIWIRPLSFRSTLIPQILPDECFLENQDWGMQAEHGYAKMLDPTTKGAQDYIYNMVNSLATGGYKLIKFDFTACDLLGLDFLKPNLVTPGWHLHNRHITNAQATKELYTLIQNAAEGSITISCNTYTHLAAGISEVMRIGADTSGRNWADTKKNGINSLVYRACENNTLYATDADCAAFTAKVPTDKNLMFAELIAKFNSALFISAHPGILKPKDIEKLIELFRLSSMGCEEATPIDWKEEPRPTSYLWNGKEYNFNWE